MSEHPVVVIGAGPIGLAAAAHLRETGSDALVLERGPSAGSAVAQWNHVRLFSPWSEVVDPAAARLLAATGWTAPDGDSYATGREWVESYLAPLAAALGDTVRFGAEVVGVARRGRDRVVDAGRDTEPLSVHIARADGSEERILARAVIDASGTWGTPNPLGSEGLPAIGEAAAAQQISYRVPDLADDAVRAQFAGKHTVIAGSGHSALTAIITFADLAAKHPGTTLTWAVRRGVTDAVFGGGESDELAARGALGQRAKKAVDDGCLQVVSGFRTDEVITGGGRLTLVGDTGARIENVDHVVALTGFRPDLSWLTEVRLDLDPTLQAPRALATLVDPNVHSCGTVYPHGVDELTQPEPGLYLVGMKSYGRAPTFLAMTGYEQVRSIAADLAGDHDGARIVELTLPDTGVCGGAGLFDDPNADTAAAGGGCCGAPAAPELISLTAPSGSRD
ncbi:NAD(P)-binding domain-containing protein [Rhodococcus sp. BP-252]|uniref:FAD-dependent oxidoreductase n=1 Tax=unclassified Rhodococcus (in: high G+C Gram-positive bacteria) TaxID=192944 RepID=UPI001C9B0892|nr:MULTISPECIES: FAD-dependent oxidoreductase [unclassified Rhodococcus (in: high G+C Gram-positive bacteria)]MBY6413302.1 NAD(P)-binding domain-containing protein [Rhodococcus sp. BP-320]MBY6418094.1 NAD(P)-binding domain-containing protein [Rhodococcus sp. BP-321]MBY6422216.1 NAD(P)-binding domain-containing protein [Rhodococcus sp. BP-324]MBY6428143.1 NAD(P)-binding domain-containing protein [Rhodococcus sp. BP-323]MBY6433223.1 NAD(P)-binding domain-containing protein [Rhodococcus sp. BP-32